MSESKRIAELRERLGAVGCGAMDGPVGADPRDEFDARVTLSTAAVEVLLDKADALHRQNPPSMMKGEWPEVFAWFPRCGLLQDSFPRFSPTVPGTSEPVEKYIPAQAVQKKTGRLQRELEEERESNRDFQDAFSKKLAVAAKLEEEVERLKTDLDESEDEVLVVSKMGADAHKLEAERDALEASMTRIRAAAESDADLATLDGLRGFLIQETAAVRHRLWGSENRGD